MVHGGAQPKVYDSSSTEIYNGSVWNINQNMNSLRSGLASAGTVNNCIAICGYDGSYKKINTTETFNGSTWVNSSYNTSYKRKKFSAVGIVNNCMIHGGAAEVNGYEYIVNTTEKCNGSSWSMSSGLTQNKYYTSSVGVTNNCMVICGRLTQADMSSTNIVEKYNGSNWSTLSARLSEIKNGTCAVGNTNNCMVQGGYVISTDGNNYRTGISEIYNGSIWSLGENMNQNKSDSTATGDTILCMTQGGTTTNGIGLSIAESYLTT